MKETYKILFINPTDFVVEPLVKGIRGLPIILAFQSDIKTAYIVDTGIPVRTEIKIKTEFIPKD